MRLLADENVPLPSVCLLRAAGYDVEAVAEWAPGSPDPDVLAYARARDRVLVTFDRDFGELVYHRGASVPPGILYLRLIPTDPEEPGRILRDLLILQEVSLEGRFTVGDRDRIRQRPLLNVS